MFKDLLLELWEQYDATVNMVVDTWIPGTGERTQVTLDDICYRNCEYEADEASDGLDGVLGECGCVIFSVLELWNYDIDLLRADPNPLMTLNNRANTFPFNQTIGGVTWGENGEVLEVAAFRQAYYIAQNKTVKDNDYNDPQADDWEESWTDLVRNRLVPYDFMAVYPFTVNEQRDEFQVEFYIGHYCSPLFLCVVSINVNRCSRRRRILSVPN
tara:strand:+ start:187 stop:828 length:642 start_codon:yes stop_codon:yes gene_type:complete